MGYRTVAHLLPMIKDTIQRIVQIKGRQVGMRSVGFRPENGGESLCGREDERALGD